MSTPSPAGASFCIPNIDARQRRQRLAAGVVGFVFALAVLAYLLISGAPLWWRLALFPLFWMGASGFFQWREKT